ncbi:helix-turn-helix domain-containing protein [Acetobacter musti]|uniref:Helix-turn-helix domain-containing protein n=1 Tax=Acetobacter musti TaxID=864732 RepID=A0ABX0JYE0_9PROT|nr:helix-turn-helix transcriptional regulator [Acetobacter musti]NHN86827.1 helix-turn-helix domain-containing protein [Acetobacter musti]
MNLALTVAHNLQFWRHARRLTVTEIASKASISVESLRSIEAGTILPTPEQLISICEVLAILPSQLVGQNK